MKVLLLVSPGTGPPGVTIQLSHKKPDFPSVQVHCCKSQETVIFPNCGSASLKAFLFSHIHPSIIQTSSTYFLISSTSTDIVNTIKALQHQQTPLISTAHPQCRKSIFPKHLRSHPLTMYDSNDGGKKLTASALAAHDDREYSKRPENRETMRRYHHEYDQHRDFLVNGGSGTKDRKAKPVETDMGNKKEGSFFFTIPTRTGG